MASRLELPLPDGARRGRARVGSHASHDEGELVDQVASGIVRSKIQPPLLRPATLERRRLLDWLDQRSDRRVLVVVAEAGYGKTTLLADHARRAAAQCFWYRTEQYDRDWITFLTHLVASIREVDETFGSSTEALLRRSATLGPSREVVLSTFLAELERLGSTPLLFLFDDFHLVDDAPDVRAIMRRLFEVAPHRARFILASRAPSDLPLGRFAARGQLAELTTDDLRFTRSELEDLFSSVYGQPQEQSVYDIIEERTEGWAASLQLVSTSLATRSPTEIRSFIRDLSGAEGPVYDFLAEEVLSSIPALTRKVLLHASLLDEIVPDLVVAALSASDDPLDASEVAAAIQDAEALGLLGRSSPTGRRRLHPLLTSFLRHLLALEVGDDAIRRTHLMVARACESSAWLVASRHYMAAGDTASVLRVLIASAQVAIATAAWPAIVELTEGLKLEDLPASLQLVRARAMISIGDVDAALALVERVESRALPHEERAMLRLTKAAVLHHRDDASELYNQVQSLVSDPDTPEDLRSLGRAWQLMLDSNRGGALAPTARALIEVAAQQRQLGLNYFGGVALHNAAVAELAQGHYDEAETLARDAMIELRQVTAASDVGPSSMMVVAASLMERGRLDDGLRLIREAMACAVVGPDAVADAVYLLAVVGRIPEADVLLGRLGRMIAKGPPGLGGQTLQTFGRIAVCLGQGRLDEAISACELLDERASPEIDAVTRGLVVRLLLRAVSGTVGVGDLAARATAAARRQGAWRWEVRIRLIEACSERNSDALVAALEESASRAFLAQLECADLVGEVLDLIEASPTDVLERSVLCAPLRWLPILRLQTESPHRDTAHAAARLLAAFGTTDDVARLVSFERNNKRRGGQRLKLAASLLRRISPTVRVRDLGRTRYEVGGRTVLISETRRRAASLLLFLVTRPGQAATREQVMDELWPDLGPSSAANSLHQTLYFLRRDLDPSHEEGSMADYIPMESEMVFIDPDLVHIDSVSFHHQALEILRSNAALLRGVSTVSLYTGRFAPEFEYEPWAESWRDTLHAVFLDLTHATCEALFRATRFRDAAALATRALAIDPLALDIESDLVRCLHAAGSSDAAQVQYRHYAAAYEREYAATPPSFSQLVDEA